MSVIDKDPFACKLACHIVQQQFHEICEVTLLTSLTPFAMSACRPQQLIPTVHCVQTACRTLLEKGISSAPELARGSGSYACSAGDSPTGSLADICCATRRSKGLAAAQCSFGTDPAQLCELLLAK